MISLKSSEAYVRSTGGHAVQCFLLARGLCLQHFALPAVFALCCLTTEGALHPSSLHAITALRTTPTLPPPSTPTTLLSPFFFNSTDAKTQSLLNGLALLSLTLFCTAADAVYPSKATLKTGHMHCVFIINVLQKYNIPSVSLSLQFETSIIIHYKKSINKQKENRTCQ